MVNLIEDAQIHILKALIQEAKENDVEENRKLPYEEIKKKMHPAWCSYLPVLTPLEMSLK